MMTNLLTPDEREAKLPAWVRSTLLELRSVLKEHQNMLRIALEEAPAKGCTGKVIAEGLTSKGFPLHDRALVTFKLPNGKIDCMLREGGTILDINSSSRMLVLPQASNSVYVRMEDR